MYSLAMSISTEATVFSCLNGSTMGYLYSTSSEIWRILSVWDTRRNLLGLLEHVFLSACGKHNEWVWVTQFDNNNFFIEKQGFLKRKENILGHYSRKVTYSKLTFNKFPAGQTQEKPSFGEIKHRCEHPPLFSLQGWAIFARLLWKMSMSVRPTTFVLDGERQMKWI